jgi:hypothetical protein
MTALGRRYLPTGSIVKLAKTQVSRDYVAEVPAGAADLRNLVSPKVPVEHDAQFRVQPYYQVFKERTGFLPNLSIVDLLFNMGPESRMVLKQSLI